MQDSRRAEESAPNAPVSVFKRSWPPPVPERGLVATIGSTIKLIHMYASPWAERVRWALTFKGVPYEKQNYQPRVGEEAVKKLTGQAQVPVLLVNGTVISDSTARAADSGSGVCTNLCLVRRDVPEVPGGGSEAIA